MSPSARPRSALSVLLPLAVLLACVLQADLTAGEACPSPQWLADRIRPVSSVGATLASIVDADPRRKAAVGAVLRHLEWLGLRKFQGRPGGGAWGCANTYHASFPAFFRVLRARVAHFGFGPGVLQQCGAEVALRREGAPPAQALYDALAAFVGAVEGAAGNALRGYGLDWAAARSSDRFALEERFRSCTYVSVLGYRSGGRWGAAGFLTNMSRDVFADEYDRGYLQEVLSRDIYGSIVPMPFRVPRCTAGGLDGVAPGTAALATWGGRPGWEHFRAGSRKRNPALAAALAESDRANEQATAVREEGVLRLLLIPLVLVLVPVGLVKFQRRRTALAFALVKDVASALPLLVKGVQLLYYTRRATYASTAFVYGARSLSDLAVAETFAARCGFNSRYRNTAALFIAIAVAAIALGIAIELATRAYIKRLQRRQRKGRTQEAVAGPVPDEPDDEPQKEERSFAGGNEVRFDGDREGTVAQRVSEMTSEDSEDGLSSHGLLWHMFHSCCR